SIHRGQLLGILHRAVAERLGPRHIHTGHHLARFGERRGGGVWAEFVDRATAVAVGRVEADLLVGCDGIHSVVRRTLYPNEGPPTWKGPTLWRAVTEALPFLSGRSMVYFSSAEQSVVVYPIAKSEEARGRARINWAVRLRTAPDGTIPEQDWGRTARAEEILGPFATFVFDFLDL